MINKDELKRKEMEEIATILGIKSITSLDNFLLAEAINSASENTFCYKIKPIYIATKQEIKLAKTFYMDNHHFKED